MNKPVRAALTVAGALALAAALNFAPLLDSRVPGMVEYRFHGMRAFARPADRAEAENLALRISRRSAAVAGALDAGATEDIGLLVYPDRKDLHRKTLGFAGAFLPDWFIGDNTRNLVLITSPAAPGPAHGRESIERAAVHEYVHVLTDRRDPRLGYWLKEGIALYLAEQAPSRGELGEHADLTWEEFSRPDALQFARVGGYSLAYTLIEYLVEVHGWDAVVALTAPGAGHEAVLGHGERELFDRWMAWLRRRLAA